MKCKTPTCEWFVSRYRSNQMQYCENCVYEILGNMIENPRILKEGKVKKAVSIPE